MGICFSCAGDHISPADAFYNRLVYDTFLILISLLKYLSRAVLSALPPISSSFPFQPVCYLDRILSTTMTPQRFIPRFRYAQLTTKEGADFESDSFIGRYDPHRWRTVAISNLFTCLLTATLLLFFFRYIDYLPSSLETCTRLLSVNCKFLNDRGYEKDGERFPALIFIQGKNLTNHPP